MMKSRIQKLLTVIVLAAQLSIMSWIIYDYRAIETKGDTYYFHLCLSSERDPIFGQYFQLSPNWFSSTEWYDDWRDSGFSSPDPDRKWRRYDKVYLLFDVDDNRFIHPTVLVADRPESGVYLVAYVEKIFSSDKIRIRPLLDRYYAQENIANEAEEWVREIIAAGGRDNYSHFCGRKSKNGEGAQVGDDAQAGDETERSAEDDSLEDTVTIDSSEDAQVGEDTQVGEDAKGSAKDDSQEKTVTIDSSEDAEGVASNQPSDSSRGDDASADAEIASDELAEIAEEMPNDKVDLYESKIWGEVSIHNGKALITDLFFEGRSIVEIIQERLDREEDGVGELIE